MTHFNMYVLVAIVVVSLGLGFWFMKVPTDTVLPIVEEIASTTPGSSSNAPKGKLIDVSPPINVQVTNKAFTLVPLASGEVISVWDFDGYFNDNGPREAEARKKIKAWESKLGGSDDYQLSVSIAQEYDHLGEGKLAYEYLSRAIATDVHNTTGTAWHNLGILMEKLGAYRTARLAHDHAIKNQPGISPFHLSRIDLMVYRFTTDKAEVEKVFAETEAVLGANDPSLIEMRKRWLAMLP